MGIFMLQYRSEKNSALKTNASLLKIYFSAIFQWLFRCRNGWHLTPLTLHNGLMYIEKISTFHLLGLLVSHFGSSCLPKTYQKPHKLQGKYIIGSCAI